MSSTRVFKRLGIMTLSTGLNAVFEGVSGMASGAIGSSILNASGIDGINVSKISNTTLLGGVITGVVEGAVIGFKFKEEDSSKAKLVSNFFSTTSCGGSLFTARQLLNALVGFGALNIIQDLTISLGDEIASATLGAAIFGVPFAIATILFSAKTNENTNTPGYNRV